MSTIKGLKAAFSGQANRADDFAHFGLTCSAYEVKFSYLDGKEHVQVNRHTRYRRPIQRIAEEIIVPPPKKKSLKKSAVTIELMEDDDIPIPKKISKPKAPDVINLEDDEEEEEAPKAKNKSPHPHATDASPVWDYQHPKTKEWTLFAGALPKMIEGLSKRSAVFPLNVPGLAGYQVILISMTMKCGASDEMSTFIRRTPPLATTQAAPKLDELDNAASSASPVPKKKGSKKSAMDVDEPAAPSAQFEVDPDLVARCKKATAWKNVSVATLAKEDKEHGPGNESKCVICYDTFNEADRAIVHLSKCGKHYFHENCIAASFKPGYVSCPVCQTIYGIRTGTQPKGTMDVATGSSRLPGYEKFGTITINYKFKDGIQEAHHPSPGAYYSGTSRTAYLPDSPEGKKVLKLLQTAFERRLVFTIGTSVTTGADNSVIWNGVHHKTSTGGGATNFGYPDETYLERVTDELSAKGVV